MILADTLKIARDGQLWYGRPYPPLERVKLCIQNGHKGRDAIEYSDGTLRCGGCLTFFRSPRSGLRNHSEAK